MLVRFVMFKKYYVDTMVSGRPSCYGSHYVGPQSFLDLLARLAALDSSALRSKFAWAAFRSISTCLIRDSTPSKSRFSTACWALAACSIIDKTLVCWDDLVAGEGGMRAARGSDDPDEVWSDSEVMPAFAGWAAGPAEGPDEEDADLDAVGVKDWIDVSDNPSAFVSCLVTEEAEAHRRISCCLPWQPDPECQRHACSRMAQSLEPVRQLKPQISRS